MKETGFSSIVRGETIIEDMQSRHVLEKQYIQPLGPSTTPDVLNRKFFEANNGSAVTVTDFKNGAPGQRIYILGDGNTTVQHGNNIFTATGANRLLEVNKVYTFTYFKDGTNPHKWVEDVDNSGGGGGGAPNVVVATRVGVGTINFTSTSYVAVDSANLDITIPAVAGDLLFVSCQGMWDNSAGSTRMDVATIVSGSIVNYISGQGASGAGVMGWRGIPSQFTTFIGGVFYTVVGGDIDSGNVLLRLIVKLSAAGSRNLLGNGADYVQVQVANYGQ